MGDRFKEMSDTDQMLSRIDDRLEEMKDELARVANGIDRLTIVLGHRVLCDLVVGSDEALVVKTVVKYASGYGE